MKKIMITGAILLCLILFTGMALLFVFSSGNVTRPADDSGVVGTRAIAETVKVPLGGVQQTMIIQGADSALPVLLYIHGGPGCPEYGLFQYFQTHLERDFTVCYWEQRGCGKSAWPVVPDSTINLSKLVEDADELALYLSHRFGQEKILCMGHSWGTLPAILAVKLHPELFRAYIGVGQVVQKKLADSARLEMLRARIIRAGNKSDLGRLDSLGKLPWVKEESYTIFHQLRMKYVKTYAMDDFLGLTKRSLLFCRAYTMKEKRLFFGNMEHVSRLLWKDTEMDVLAEVPEIRVPVWFIQGEDDFITPSMQVESYRRQVKSPSGGFVLMPNASHSPMFDQPLEFRNLIWKINQEINEEGG